MGNLALATSEASVKQGRGKTVGGKAAVAAVSKRERDEPEGI